MTAKLLLFVCQEDDCWNALAEKYGEDYRIEDVLELARLCHPGVVREDNNENGEVEGEIQDENERYILTWEDSISECMRIYEKQK